MGMFVMSILDMGIFGIGFSALISRIFGSKIRLFPALVFKF